jgi:hypothetical protein
LAARKAGWRSGSSRQNANAPEELLEGSDEAVDVPAHVDVGVEELGSGGQERPKLPVVAVDE